MRLHGFSALAVLVIAASFMWFAPVAAVQAQVTCGATTVKQTFPGGHIVERTCNGRLIGGVGSNLTAAQANLSSFTGLMPAKSCRVGSDPVYQFAGGYRTTFDCSDQYGGGYSVSGIGSTATDAGQNAFAFGQLYAALNDISCSVSNSDISAFTGGFKINTNCIKQGSAYPATVTGIGSTATDAGKNARGFAELVASGTTCLMTQAISYSGGLFHAVFSCDGYPVHGYGSTVTAAGNDALSNASLL